MFSPTIQGFIDQGGKEAAMQRVQSIRAHVANIEKQINTVKAANNVQNNVQNTIANVVNPTKKQILDIISKVSQKYGVDEKLVQAVIRQESGFNPKARSHCGAMGLMQLMPSTAQGLGVTNAYDAEQNIMGGTKYLKGLMDRFDNNKSLALAAYNAGPNAVKKYGGIPPYAETQNYVKKVLSNYDNMKGAN